MAETSPEINVKIVPDLRPGERSILRRERLAQNHFGVDLRGIALNLRG